MKTVFLCIGFYGLGVFNCAVFAAVYLLHRPRYTAPTLRRKYRDLPVPETTPPWDRSPYSERKEELREVEGMGGVDYRFINLTGEER